MSWGSINAGAIGIYAAAPMLISKAECDEWVRTGGGFCAYHQRLAIRPDTLRRKEDRRGDIEKSVRDGERGEGLARQAQGKSQ